MRKELFFSITLSMALVFGCSGGGGGGSSSSNVNTSSSNVNTSFRVPAENIIFTTNTSANNAGAKAYNAAYSNVDPSTQILAQNVVVNTTSNALTSNNLQSALDNEMAIDLAKLLPGSTWTITNKTKDPMHIGTIGKITFNTDGTLTIVSGHLAASGLISESEASPCSPSNPVSYELLSNSIMYFSWTDRSGFGRDAAITVISHDKNSLVLLGGGGCGVQGVDRISVLTIVSSAQNVSFKPEKKTKSTGTLLVSNKKQALY